MFPEQSAWPAARTNLADSAKRLTLGELEASASAFLSVFLTFLATCVTGKKARSLQTGTKLGVVHGECASDAELNSSSLAAFSATANGAVNVETLAGLGLHEGLTQDHHQGVARKVRI